MSKEDLLAKKALLNNGLSLNSSTLIGDRVVYPAIVVPNGTNDNSEQNRIRARIVNVQDDGKIQGKIYNGNEENYNQYTGKDRNILDKDLVLCVPLLPDFFHVKPQVGEMVFVICENPKDQTSVRYWIGPIITSKLKMSFQSYEDSYSIFNKTTFLNNTKINSNVNISSLFPSDADVAIQGRNDSDLILKNKEAILIAGKFSNLSNLKINTESPSYIKLKQINNTTPEENKGKISIITNNISADIIYDSSGKYIGNFLVTDIFTSLEIINDTNSYINKNDTINWLKNKIEDAKIKYPNWSFNTNSTEFKNLPNRFDKIVTNKGNNNEILQNYSEALLTSTNINLFSPIGKFRGDDIKNFEKNKYLQSFGKFADTLHPVTFGDENIKLLDLIIKVLLTHIHHPQKEPLNNSLIDSLKEYTVEGKLQNLISNHIRIN